MDIDKIIDIFVNDYVKIEHYVKFALSVINISKNDHFLKNSQKKLIFDRNFTISSCDIFLGSSNFPVPCKFHQDSPFSLPFHSTYIHPYNYIYIIAQFKKP